VSDDEQPLGQILERAIGDAIDQAVGQHEGGLVTKWVALVESVGPDGDRGLWTMTSRGVMAWETKGLLQHGLDLQLAQTIHPPDDDDE
jgi:hypothetical protein